MYGKIYKIPPPIEQRVFEAKSIRPSTPCEFQNRINKKSRYHEEKISPCCNICI